MTHSRRSQHIPFTWLFNVMMPGVVTGGGGGGGAGGGSRVGAEAMVEKRAEPHTTYVLAGEQPS